uniref:Fucolectin tachylectin-4 pentraxin-1 domain-containing protein n=1 Tax=Latimeria chalumnae TaxID=7897 RepID=H3B360_LATCH
LNVALYGKADQSSVYQEEGMPEHAIDGNKNSNYVIKSCTHTIPETGPWWRVDLKKPHQISRVAITNRGDCCAERLEGAEVRVGQTICYDNSNPHKNSMQKLLEINQEVNISGFKINWQKSECLSICQNAEVYGEVCEVPELNVALHGTADQSSVYQEEGMPEHAIDGNKNSNYMIKSCTHTIPEMGPWWRVDLKKPHQISRVAITNRGDCCAERLEGAEVRIGNSLDNNGNNNPKCGAVESTSAWSTHTFCCSGMEGRYVSIVIPGRKDVLSLCEVEIFGIPAECPSFLGELNVALHGTADQSSVYHEEGMPEHAIDGNKNSNYTIKSCTHTIPEMGPWWRVDLKKPHQISRVAITNRGDCCAERLVGAEIRIGNSLDNNGNNNPNAEGVETVRLAVHVSCSTMEAHQVTILVGEQYVNVSICKNAQVYGEVCEDVVLELNVALYGKADQSSVYHEEGMPEHAIDGNKNSNYTIKSCTHTIPETGPWWRVDLKKPHQISRVAITNRGDCCAERLEGAEVRIGNSLDNNGNNNPKCATVESPWAGSTETFCCYGMEGRYVNIVIPGREVSLTLCEVEVYGVPA